MAESSTKPTSTATESAPPAEKGLAGTTDTEAVKAQEKADKQAAADAEARIAPTENQMSREEYDKIGKGPDYEPHGTKDNTFTYPTPVAGTKEASAKAKAESTKES